MPWLRDGVRITSQSMGWCAAPASIGGTDLPAACCAGAGAFQTQASPEAAGAQIHDDAIKTAHVDSAAPFRDTSVPVKHATVPVTTTTTSNSEVPVVHTRGVGTAPGATLGGSSVLAAGKKGSRRA